ncbi:MAG: PKD domain-containing protein [Verrucomicrobiia bacterium]
MKNAQCSLPRSPRTIRKQIRNVVCTVLFLTSWLACSASSQTVTQWVAMGRAALVSNDILTANTDFSNAVAVGSSNPDANFFYAFTRIAVLPCQTNPPAGPVAQLLTEYGIPTTGRDPWKWTADFQRNLFNQIVLPTNCPTEGVALGVLTNTVLPQIAGALTNLTHVPHSYSTVIGPELNRTNSYEVNYNAEVVLYQSALQAAQGAILTLNSYNLDANVSAIVSNLEAGTFNLNSFLAASPQFLTPTSVATSSLPSAATALDTAINEFEDGSSAVYAQRGRPLGSPGLMQGMLDFDDALYGPVLISFKDTNVTLTVDLTPFFYTGPVNLRSLFPQIQIDPLNLHPRIVADSFPDPTFDEILPDATQQWWVDFKPLRILFPGDMNWQTAPFGANGLDADALAMAVSGTNLYVGGYFATAGTTNDVVNGIALWNGSSWSALGSGVAGLYGGYVDALAVNGTNLYVGGVFTNAGGVAANNIAVWNGSSWSALGSGVSGYVDALAVNGTNLYVGGSFTNAGGVAANNIAVWNGSSWSALGSGVAGLYGGYVDALAVSSTNLYVGGYFTNAGGVAVNNIAVWNGSSWSALGGGVYDDEGAYAQALAVSGTNVYVGGSFTNAGGVAANDIAIWNGSSWSALGSGIGTANDDANDNEYVESMAMDGTSLLVGGYFSRAGGWKASNIALWHTPVAAVPSASFFANPASGIAPLTVTFTDTSIGIVTNWYWDFGDGSTTNVTTPSVTHTYSLGTYTVTVVVTGPGGVDASTQPNAVMAMTVFQAWQMQYFRCTDCPQAQPDADPLGKGMSNTNQFLAGLNPTNANSVLRITSLAGQGSNMVVTWKTAGVRTNVVQATKGSAAGGYSNSFQDISGPIILNISGDTSTNYIDAGGATNRPSRYYRIRLGP